MRRLTQYCHADNAAIGGIAKLDDWQPRHSAGNQRGSANPVTDKPNANGLVYEDRVAD